MKSTSVTYNLSTVLLAIVILVAFLEPVFRIFVGLDYQELDLSRQSLPPLSKGMLLGSDGIGRSVALGTWHGLFVAFKLAFFTTLIASIIGAMIALVSTSHLIRPKPFRLFKVLFWALVVWYSGFLIIAYFDWSQTAHFVWMFFVLITFILIWIESHGKVLKKDLAVVKSLELIKVIPGILILIVISGTVQKLSHQTLILILSFLIWPVYTRLLRGEFMRLSGQPFVKTAIASGSSIIRIYLKHLLPNAFTPLIAYACFSCVSIILLEATLSYLGIGVPPEEVTLGSMIRESTLHLDRWWLAVIPGLCLLTLLMTLNSIGTRFISKHSIRN